MKNKISIIFLLLILITACSHLAETQNEEPVEELSLDQELEELDTLLEDFDDSELEELEKELGDI